MNKKRQRPINSLDLISVISAFAVTFLHANNCYWTFSSTERYWITANIIENLFYFAVPLFLMISGVTLLDYRNKYSTKEFIKKRIKKVLIPYIIWSLIGIFWVYILFPEKYGVDNLSVKHIINMLLNGNGIRYFWFFIPLFMIYFSIPFISEICSDHRIKLFSGYIFLFLVMNGTLPLLDSLFNLGLYFEKWRVPVISGYLVYPLAGYVIYNIKFSKYQKTIILSVGFLALVVMTAGTYYESLRINEINNIFKGDQNLPCLLYSFAMFLLLKEIFIKFSNNTKVLKIISFLRPYTFSVYLLQFFVFESVTLFTEINQKSIVYRVLFPFILYAIIILITKFLRKFKIGKLVLPD